MSTQNFLLLTRLTTCLSRGFLGDVADVMKDLSFELSSEKKKFLMQSCSS